MKSIKLSTVLVVGVICLNGLSTAVAHDAHDSHPQGIQAPHTETATRTWRYTSEAGTTTPSELVATFLTANEDRVLLQRANGFTEAIPMEKLLPADRDYVIQRQTKIARLNAESILHYVAVSSPNAETSDEAPPMAGFFAPFEKGVKVRWNSEFLFVESNGMPAHAMMTGITAWQQQVPIPQSYTGDNAWRIPLHPVPAESPMSAKSNFFRGAIALAVNGVPIFNPIKNDGKTDTLLAGELDQWGGHCGRADDYHYHIAPLHLEKIVGKDKPLGVALDGYPIYGYDDPNGESPQDLDWLNGHHDDEGNYHYHATKQYPYINGGFFGTVVERGGQVDPQPRAEPIRPAMPPLRGAKITGFESLEPGSFIVHYEVNGEKRSVQYSVKDNGMTTFKFVTPSGTETKTYSPGQRGGRDAPEVAR